MGSGEHKKWIWPVAMGLILVALAFIVFFGSNEEGKATVETEKQEEQEIPTFKKGEKDKALETVNAYDYILSVMNAPQYWSEDEYFPEYSALYLKEEAKEALLNGTGWKLKDENEASFERGYETKLTINFSEHKAVSEEPGGTKYVLDYKNDDYYVELNGEKHGLTINNNLDGYWNTSFGMLEKTFNDYEEMFSKAGCPLLNMPKGTLLGYKKKKVTPVLKEDDGLIHAVWKEKGFSFNWEESDKLIWLDDYKEIEDMPVPSSELFETTYERFDGSIERFAAGINSPLYLVLADTESSKIYQKYDGSNWFESILCYDNVTEALCAYYLAPAMEDLYGYSGVYFTDCRKLVGSESPYMMSSKEEFEKGITINYETEKQAVLEVFPLGDMFVSAAYTYDADNRDYRMLISRVKSLYEYYGKEYPYGEDYLGNFLLVYSLEAQTLLGLR